MSEASQNSNWPLITDRRLNFVTPQLKRLHEVWLDKRGARAMPSRADMTLRDLKFALPHVAFLAVVGDGARIRFRVRLIGSELESHVGSMTGQFVDEAVPGKFAEKWSAPWCEAVEARCPVRSAGRAEFRDRQYLVAESFCAPLAEDGEQPVGIFLGSYYHVCESGEAAQGEISRRLLNEIDAAR